MTEKEYLPFKTINVFLDHAHLQKTLEFILKNINKLPKANQIAFSNAFKEYVNILGFRNPTRAPLQLQVNAYATAFEDKDEVIPFTLSTWAKINDQLAGEVKSWLDSEGWKDLSEEKTFEESKGFLHDWPDNLSVEELTEKFLKAHPKLDVNEEDLTLMILWIFGRLPDEETGL